MRKPRILLPRPDPRPKSERITPEAPARLVCGCRGRRRRPVPRRANAPANPSVPIPRPRSSSESWWIGPTAGPYDPWSRRKSASSARAAEARGAGRPYEPGATRAPLHERKPEQRGGDQASGTNSAPRNAGWTRSPRRRHDRAVAVHGRRSRRQGSVPCRAPGSRRPSPRRSCTWPRACRVRASDRT